MSIWVARGLRDGIVTTRWPKHPDEYEASWRGPATIGPQAPAGAQLPGDLAGLCPTGAITTSGHLAVDQGRCIACGWCVAARPEVFSWSAGASRPASPALAREAMVIPQPPETEERLAHLRAALAARTAALRRSVHIRHLDAGSDGSEEWEVQALLGPVYDIGRLGFFFTASPRHADVLLVTGAGTPGMAGPLRATYEGMPDPKVVIAVGADAASGGLLAGEAAGQLTGIGGLIGVDVWVAGSPPSPFEILAGLLAATGRLPRAARPGRAQRGGPR